MSFDIAPGETLGLVGESGCGKSTTGRCILRLVEPTAGEVRFDGRDVTAAGGAELRRLRRQMQIIFQDPFASLNPRHTVRGHRRRGAGDPRPRPRRARPVRPGGASAGDGGAAARPHAPLRARVLGRAAPAHRHRARPGGAAQAAGVRRAGLGAGRLGAGAGDQPAGGPAGAARPHLSVHRPRPVGGGAHQRPRGGDVSRPRGGDRPRARAVRRPAHPYTEALLSAVPIPDPTVRRQRIVLRGDVPSPIHPPSGCHFHTRCPIAEARCSVEVPRAGAGGQDGHWVACHLRRAG